MIEKYKILKYLTQEIKNMDIAYNNFSWFEYIGRGIMEKISALEDIKNLIENGKFDCKKETKDELS